MHTFKLVLLAALAALPTSFFGQDYQPLSADNFKRFQSTLDENLPDEFYYPIAFDESESGQTLQQYYQRKDLVNYWDNDGPCLFWGGPTDTVNVTWLGTTIEYNLESQSLLLHNEAGEALNFDLNTSIGDSSIFYSNDILSAYLIGGDVTQEMILGYTDSVRHHLIKIYDNDGTLIPSQLNGLPISVGKSTGLNEFIDAYHFPVTQSHYSLKGQSSPPLGYYMLTYDEAYPWQAEDVIQYQGTFTDQYYGMSTISYKTLTVSDRIETVDSVFIHLDSDYYEVSQGPEAPITFPYFNIFIPNPITYEKGSYISSKPVGYIDAIDGEPLISISATSTECSEHEVSLREYFRNYCDSCSCFGGYDGFYSSSPASRYGSQRGQIGYSIIPYGGPSPSSIDRYATQIYSNINGVECGNRYVVGLEENEISFDLYPNPVVDKLLINHAFEDNPRYEIYTSSGQLVIDDKLLLDGIIDLHELGPGYYLIRLSDQQGISTLSFIKE